MAKTAYLSRKLLNQLKVKETESTNLMLTHNLHNITINGKRVGCSGHIQNVLNDKCVYICTEKSCYQPLSDKNLVRYAADMRDFSSYDLGAKGRIIMRNRETFGLSDHEVLNMAYDWSGKGLDFLYKRGWIAIRNPSMGNTFLDMDETKTATKAQVNTIFDYISKFNRYDMNISKVMVD